MAQETAHCDLHALFKAFACVLADSFVIVHVLSTRIHPTQKTNYRNVHIVRDA